MCIYWFRLSNLWFLSLVDENDEETLNENDDEEEPLEDDKDIPHLVMCQFDSV